MGWFDSLDAHPNKLGVDGAGFSGKVGSFRSNDTRLRTNGFLDVERFSLYSLEPDGKIPLLDWRVTCEVAPPCCTASAPSEIAPLPGDTMLAVSKVILREFAPVYGIGFRREMRFGPTCYSFGLVQGLLPVGPDAAESNRISSWEPAIEQGVYEAGLLRGVYSWNFLSSVHLDRRVDGERLRRWIELDPLRGSLTPVAEGVMLWEVPDRKIRDVHLQLQRAGAIFEGGFI